MIAWKGLLKKEWKLLKFSFIINLILLIVMPMIVFSISRYFSESLLFTSIMIGIMFAHIFYLPALFFEALNKEGNTQLWLYNPNSISKMVLAKFFTSFAIFFFSLTMIMIITYVISLQLGSFNIDTLYITENELIFTSSLIILSNIVGGSYLSLWILFLWSIYHSLAQKPILKHLRWPLLIAIILATQICSEFISKTPIYIWLKKLWVIKINSFSFQTELNNMSWQFQIGTPGMVKGVEIIEFSVIVALIQIIIAFLMYIFSTWLLDRKVEV